MSIDAAAAARLRPAGDMRRISQITRKQDRGAYCPRHQEDLPVLRTAIAALAAVTLAAALPAAAHAAAPLVQRYSFTLAPGGSTSISLPVATLPVEVNVTLSAQNTGTQTPSELARVLVNEDSSSRQLTWIGTSSDGSSSAGTTLAPATVATIGGGNLAITATAGTATALGKLVFTQSASRTTINGHYEVTVIY
jgi:hypothetical protein